MTTTILTNANNNGRAQPATTTTYGGVDTIKDKDFIKASQSEGNKRQITTLPVYRFSTVICSRKPCTNTVGVSVIKKSTSINRIYAINHTSIYSLLIWIIFGITSVIQSSTSIIDSPSAVNSPIAPAATTVVTKKVFSDPPPPQPPPQPPPDTMPGSSTKKNKCGGATSMAEVSTDLSKEKKQDKQTKLPFPVENKTNNEDDMKLDGGSYPFNNMLTRNYKKNAPTVSAKANMNVRSLSEYFGEE